MEAQSLETIVAIICGTAIIITALILIFKDNKKK